MSTTTLQPDTKRERRCFTIDGLHEYDVWLIIRCLYTNTTEPHGEKYLEVKYELEGIEPVSKMLDDKWEEHTINYPQTDEQYNKLYAAALSYVRDEYGDNL